VRRISFSNAEFGTSKAIAYRQVLKNFLELRPTS
jgi:hypothetical protein